MKLQICNSVGGTGRPTDFSVEPLKLQICNSVGGGLQAYRLYWNSVGGAGRPTDFIGTL